MGVRKLNKFLTDKGLTQEYSDLEHYIEHIRSDPDKNNNRIDDDKIVIAIDFWLYVHKFLHSSKSTNIALAFLNQIIRFLTLGIIPIYVADGCVPIEKEEEYNNRNESRNRKLDDLQMLYSDYDENITEMDRLERHVKRASRDDMREILNIFDLMNIKLVRARYEADALCTLMYREQMITACLSDDMDMLALGCGKTIRIERGKIIEYDLERILRELKLTHEQFVDLCIIFGSGYLKHPVRIDGETAYDVIRKSGSLLDAMFSCDHPEFNVETRNINVIGENYHNAFDVYMESPNREKIEFEVDVPRFNNYDVINYLRGAEWYISSSKNIRHMKYDLYCISKIISNEKLE